jgi:hypothetical protein
MEPYEIKKVLPKEISGQNRGFYDKNQPKSRAF